MKQRLDIEVRDEYGHNQPTQIVQVFIPDLGNVDITYEQAPGELAEVMISIDFTPNAIRVVDAHGNTHQLGIQ